MELYQSEYEELCERMESEVGVGDEALRWLEDKCIINITTIEDPENEEDKERRWCLGLSF